jgi:hypothetical protein
MFRIGTPLWLLNIYQSLIRAIGNTRWYFLSLAEVTFEHLSPFFIEFQSTQRADQQARAATDAPLLIHRDERTQRVTRQSTGKARLNTGSILTMLTPH